MISFWSSLCHFLNKQILISEIRPVLYTNRTGLCIFILRSETTHPAAIYNIYSVPGATRGGLRAETEAQATQGTTVGPCSDVHSRPDSPATENELWAAFAFCEC